MLSLAELEARGVGVEMRELRAWRLRQLGPTGRRLALCDLAGLVGCSVSTIGAVERGLRSPAHALRVRLWALMLGGEVDWMRTKPATKVRRTRKADVPPAQMLLPFAS